MTTVTVEVDIDLDAVSDRDLIREVKERRLSVHDDWNALPDDLSFRLAIQRGDADQVLSLVAEALRIPTARAA